MNYEIVNLEEKIVVGLSAGTSNSDPKMGEKVTKLWTKLCYDGVKNQIKNKVNDYVIGLYSDYSGDSYVVTAGAEVSESANSGMTTKVIPAGKYAKFSFRGHMQKAVAEAWQAIWKMDLDRSYTGDFEEYYDNNWENGEICIYIALK